MPPNDCVRLLHILDAAREATALMQGRTRADLAKDRLLVLGLMHLLEIIGEAARGVSAQMGDQHPEIPWKKMTAMRDRLIHGYFDINLDIVWQTVASDLPQLTQAIEPIVHDAVS